MQEKDTLEERAREQEGKMEDSSREEWIEDEWIEQELARLEREAREEKIEQKLARLKKEEKINQEIARLEQLIEEKDYEFDKEQWKRTKRTFFVLCGLILLYLVFESDIDISEVASDINLSGVLGLLGSVGLVVLGVAFAAGFIMFLSYGVWFYVMNGAMKRVETIAKLEGELNAIKFSKYNKE